MIGITHDQGIAILRLDHGMVNALDAELLAAVVDALDDAEQADASAIVLTGTGSTFSAGADLVRLLNEGPAYVADARPHAARVFERMFTMPIPVVAAVNGHAIAGGFVLALACDHRVASAGDHRLGLAELRVGVPFPVWALEIVRYAVAQPQLQRLLYSGRLMTSGDALALGLVDEVVDPDVLMPTALAVARRLASIPRRTFALTKRSLRSPYAERAAAGSALDDEAMDIWASEETRAAVRRFIDRTLGRREAR